MEKHTETRHLVCRAQGGDREAYDSLVERYRQRVGSTIRSRLADNLKHSVEVEELVQETMVRAFRSLDKFKWRDEGSYFAWLCAIARHVVLKSVEQGRRYRALEINKEVLANGTSPSKTLRRDERFDRLEVALRGLSSDHQKVIRLARVEGLPIKDIATRMNRSPGAVKVLLFRALHALKKNFGDTESLHLPDRRLAEGGSHDE